MRAIEGATGSTTVNDPLSHLHDLHKIVFPSKREAEAAIVTLRAMGYDTWPVGRPLEEVVTWVKP